MRALLASFLLVVTACQSDAPATIDSAGTGGTTASGAVAPAPPSDPAAPSARAYYVARGICPFECCHYGPWVAEGPVEAYARELSRDSVVFRIASGDTIVADTGNVHIMVPGVVVVGQPVTMELSSGKPFGSAAPGDTVFVLEYHGEGYYNVRHRGRDAEVESFWSDSTRARLVREPVQEWWARVRAKDGRQGWVRMNDARIGDVDLCG